MASRILLADDSITIQKVVNLTFADEGIEVVAVSNGEMAERRLNEINPDLVLADIFMPGKNGYELCEHIKQSPQFQNVPVVLLVGAFEPFDQGEARRVKADAHLTKPFESRNLVETVRKLIKDSGRPATGSSSHTKPVEETLSQPQDRVEMKPISPPPVNIDFSAMSNDWQSVDNNTGFDAESAMGFTTMDGSSSITIDTDEDHSAQQGESARFDHTLAMGSPFVSSAASEASEPQDINLSIADPAQAQESRAESEDKTLSADSDANESIRVGVPSAFGHSMQEVIVDFEKSDEPQQPEPENVVSLDTEESPSVVDETDYSAADPVERDEQSAQLSGIEVHTEEQVAPMDAAADFAESEVSTYETSETSEPAVELATASDEEPIETLSPQTLLETDNPLGDVLVDERAQSAAFQESAYDESAPLSDSISNEALDLAAPAVWSDTSSDSVRPHLSAGFSSQSHFEVAAPSASYEAQAVAETTHSAVAVEDLPASETSMEEGSNFEIVMAATEDMDWQARESETDTEPPAEASASDQWATVSAFAAIDAETVKIEEHQAETVPVETGFEFKPVSASHTDQTEEAEPIEAESSVPKSEPAAMDSAVSSEISEAVIDQIVRRVIKRMSSDVVREIAWEVVPDMVERAVQEVARDSVSKKI